MKRWVLASLLAVGGLVAIAQDDGKPRTYRARFDNRFGSTAHPVVGAPFSARTLTEREPKQPNIVKKETRLEVIYRDALGRIRTDRSLVLPDEGPGLRFAQIVDPVGGYEYFLDPVNKLAHRITVPPADPEARSKPFQLLDYLRPPMHSDLVHGSGFRGAAWVKPDRETTELGEKTIDGVLVRGTRIVETFPNGVLGKGSPATMLIETWISEARKLAVLTTRQDSVNGYFASRTVDYDPREPAWDLFVPPSDYQVIDEKGPWSVEIVIPTRTPPSGKK